MRVSREQFQQNREKILEAAGRLFRERGFEAVGVADVMKAAGLTHGGFYGHFKSKDDLIAQAIGALGPQIVEQWGRVVEAEGGKAVGLIADQYLGDDHCRGVGSGCAIAALGPEIARLPDGARDEVTRSMKDIVAVLQKAEPGGEGQARRAALKAYASWIGAMVVARISSDEAFSREVREAVAQEG